MIATDRLDYPLPPELVAQRPAERRDASRLLVVDRQARSLAHTTFSAIADDFAAGDILLRNTASVLAARLRGRRSTGGKVECLLLARVPGASGHEEIWRCLLRPGRRLPPGAEFEVADGALSATVSSVLADGSALVRFRSPAGESVVAAAQRIGEVPLPPYIERKDESLREEDRARYQTVYADTAQPVAEAAPTAGLHFSPPLLAKISSLGVRTADLTLHVGLGTFRPIATATVETHPIHAETYELPRETQSALFPPLSGRRIAVGTTAVRSIEDFLVGHERPVGGTAHRRGADLHLPAPSVHGRGCPHHQFPSAAFHPLMPGRGLPHPRISRRH